MRTVSRTPAEHVLGRSEVSAFRRIIYSHFRKSGRKFPWRDTFDPYRIFVSEVMLQQTPVERVKIKYEGFLARFPDFHTLANAPLRDILEEWQGLGYNRRAIALKKCAEKVMSQFRGNLPSETGLLTSLPGVGLATAAAVRAFAFCLPSVLIETNIRRVFIHFFFADEDTAEDRDILHLIEASLDRKDPRRWYYALMDYGAMLRKNFPNPNSKSSHYRPQPRFEGSERQLRGKILGILITGGVTVKRLQKLLNTSPSRILKIIEELGEEGFLKKSGRVYTLL